VDDSFKTIKCLYNDKKKPAAKKRAVVFSFENNVIQ